MHLFGQGKELVFHSSLNVAECERRLESSVDKEGVWVGLTGTGGFLGQVRGDEFTLRKRMSYRNLFSPIFFGSLTPEAGGTRITGLFAIHPLIKLMVVIGIGGLLFYEIAVKRDPASIRVGIYMSLGFLAFVFLGMWLGKREEKPVLSFLMATLEAREGI